MHDLIIVGAGPVGSHLAKKYAEKDKDVLVIERSDEIGTPLACSGHVSPDIWDFVPESERERLYQNEIKGANFIESNNDYKFYKDETVSYVIDRVELDKVKAEQAQKAGANYNLDEEVIEVDQNDEFVQVETDKCSYRAKMVAGCDGASSKVRSEVDIEDPHHFYQGILCFTDEKDSSDFVDVWTGVPSFFGWRIPRGDSVEYGAAVPKGENPMNWLEKMTDKFDVKEKKNICAGAIPIGPPKHITSDRLFLAGDAGAQTKPFTGGGILYGMRCADTASEVIDIDSPQSLNDYEKEWRNELIWEIRGGRLIETAYSAPSIFRRLGMSIFEGEIGVHMDHPTSFFSKSQLKAMLKPSGGIKNFSAGLFNRGE